eukprot:GFUD01022340.1.p1 GENE.GFUD01022340.1~~GFUD01022340.1.p1  ORF type:complete len:175 (+),score=53.62 GFUD01022340.1:223-747(+)
MIPHDYSPAMNACGSQHHESSSRLSSTSTLQPNLYPFQKLSSSSKHKAVADFPSQLHFKKGSMIQLASGKMKNVEDLKTEDFIQSAALCPDVSMEHSTVVRLEHIQPADLFLLSFSVGRNTEEVTISASPEHPFFVYGHGWSSCYPSLTMARYSLDCDQLKVGDVCVSLARNRQ